MQRSVNCLFFRADQPNAYIAFLESEHLRPTLVLGIREGTVNSRLFYGCRKLGGKLAISEGEDLIAELLNE